VREEKYRSAEAALPVTSFDSCSCNSDVHAVEFDAEIGNIVCPVATTVSSRVLADDKCSPIGVAKTIAAVNVTDSLILGGSTLPASLQGFFWLTNQKTSSAAMSFGGPSNDGGGSSTGRLSDTHLHITCITHQRHHKLNNPSH